MSLHFPGAACQGAGLSQEEASSILCPPSSVPAGEGRWWGGGTIGWLRSAGDDTARGRAPARERLACGPRVAGAGWPWPAHGVLSWEGKMQ